jgi:hypothetical protein
MTFTNEELIDIVRLRLGAFQYDSDRREFMDELTEGWCRDCGCEINGYGCYCMRGD